MRVVGELLVARGAFPLLVQKLNDGADGAGLMKDLKEAGSNISRIADELQTSVMSIRMLPVKTVFQRFPRLVRDLARSLGKEVRLVVEGEGIELDKTILEQIGDPLVHVIRNAVDHGLEIPEERRAKGKEASGQLTLRAIHEAGGVAIEVTDDGRGLDAGALKRKAVEKGLLTAEAADGMSEEAAFQLIFLPGLIDCGQGHRRIRPRCRDGCGPQQRAEPARHHRNSVEARPGHHPADQAAHQSDDFQGHPSGNGRAGVHPAAEQYSRYGQAAGGSRRTNTAASPSRRYAGRSTRSSAWRKC